MRLLFVCTHNACRSILGEVITRALGGDRIEAASAGSNPAGRVHPLTIKYLDTHGYSTTGLRSKSFADVQAFNPDAVITVCDRAANEGCPVWLGGAVKTHWGLPDPSHLEGSDEERLAAFDVVRAIISRRIEALLQQSFEDMEADQLAVLLRTIGEKS